MRRLFLIVSVVYLGTVWAASQAPHEHAGLQQNRDQTMGGAVVPETPPSGAARSTGYRGREVMPAMRADDPLASRCALARDGIIILDRATWARCGDEMPVEDAVPRRDEAAGESRGH